MAKHRITARTNPRHTVAKIGGRVVSERLNARGEGFVDPETTRITIRERGGEHRKD